LLLLLAGTSTSHAMRRENETLLEAYHLTESDITPLKDTGREALRFSGYDSNVLGKDYSSSNIMLTLRMPEGEPQGQVVDISIQLRKVFQTGGVMSPQSGESIASSCPYKVLFPCSQSDDGSKACYTMEKNTYPTNIPRWAGQHYFSVKIYGIADAAFFGGAITPIGRSGLKGEPFMVAFSTMPSLRTWDDQFNTKKACKGLGSTQRRNIGWGCKGDKCKSMQLTEPPPSAPECNIQDDRHIALCSLVGLDKCWKKQYWVDFTLVERSLKTEISPECYEGPAMTQTTMCFNHFPSKSFITETGLNVKEQECSKAGCSSGKTCCCRGGIQSTETCACSKRRCPAGLVRALDPKLHCWH